MGLYNLPGPVVSDNSVVKKEFSLPGEVCSLILSLISLPIVLLFFEHRLRTARSRRLNIASLTLLASYFTSFLYIFILAVIIHLRIFGRNEGLCDATLFICLTLFIITKMTGFAFLIERLYIISWPITPRHKHPEYIITSLCIYAPYIVAAGVCLKYRVAYDNLHNVCIIGMKAYALIPLICVEVSAYLYLTIRFLVPLLWVHFTGQGLLNPLRGLVKRTVIGTAITTISVLATKLTLTFFDGEPAWLCCLTCKIDAFLAVCVMHWITATDHKEDHPPGLNSVELAMPEHLLATCTDERGSDHTKMSIGVVRSLEERSALNAASGSSTSVEKDNAS